MFRPAAILALISTLAACADNDGDSSASGDRTAAHAAQAGTRSSSRGDSGVGGPLGAGSADDRERGDGSKHDGLGRGAAGGGADMPSAGTSRPGEKGARGEDASIEGSTDSDAPPTDPSPLRAAASTARKQVGALVHGLTLAADASYAAVLAREFSSVTADTMSWAMLQGTRGLWLYDEADAVVTTAGAVGQAVRGRSLMGPDQEPAWVATLSSAELQTELQRHIKAVVTRYKGHVTEWDVLHEAIDPTTLQLRAGLLTKLGIPGLAQVFIWARQADPRALLYYNDSGIEGPGPKADAALRLIEDLKAAGAPIDGVGFEAHLDTTGYPAESALRANLRRFAAVVPHVAYTELDVGTKQADPAGSALRRFAAQRLTYQLIAGVCASEPACRGVTTCGLSDQQTWIVGDDPLPFDAAFMPKPAYDGLVAGFMGQLPVLAAEERLRDGDFEMPADDSWVSFGDGTLAIQTAIARTGSAVSVTGRTQSYEGPAQSLLGVVMSDDALCVTAQVRVDVPSARVRAMVKLGGGAEASYRTLAATTANATSWTELAGCGALYVDRDLPEVTLFFDGPPAGVSLYVDDASAKALDAL